MATRTNHDEAGQLRQLPLLALRNGVLFPGLTIAVPLGRARSLAMAEAVAEGGEVVVACQRDRDQDAPGLDDLHAVATLAVVRRKLRLSNRQMRLVLEGRRRVQLAALESSDPFWTASFVEADADEPPERADPETQALADSLLPRVTALGLEASEGLKARLESAELRHDPGALADTVAAALGLSTERELNVLATVDVAERLRLLHDLISEVELAQDIRGRIDREVRQGLSKGHREAMLRQQLRAIHKELGEEGHEQAATEELRARITAAGLSAEAAEVAERELTRLQSMPAAQPEHHVIRRYLDFMADLPWERRAEVNEDHDAVAARLDADHFGLDEVKRRILEHLAVHRLTAGKRGTQLCLVGPPGVGKTSLGRSIAEATGRPFQRISLGGVRDEAEIRGHRRTYVGALPGRILAAMRKAGARNPVLLIDEVDKLTQGWMGSPESALLEVLDPEQNHTFADHYLEVPFDLSEVLFLCTANSLETLSAPLRDRMEIVELEGYTPEEKLHIAEDHLLPDELEAHGLQPSALEISSAALERLVVDYTREAGVRQLKRELARIIRAVTVQVARGEQGTTEVGPEDLNGYLGKPKFFHEAAERTSLPGVATGLAWTPSGGDVLFVESSAMPGGGKLEITGKLGDVMKESARAALTYLRSHAHDLGVAPDFFESQDIHIHIPAGAVAKDGPSAGVTIFTALTSLVTGRLVRGDTAMTGECTLRGRVLPVGGIKAKVLAAHRAGVRRIVLPLRNERDLEDIPDSVRQQLEFILVKDMSEVLGAALEPLGVALSDADGGAVDADFAFTDATPVAPAC